MRNIIIGFILGAASFAIGLIFWLFLPQQTLLAGAWNGNFPHGSAETRGYTNQIGSWLLSRHQDPLDAVKSPDGSPNILHLVPLTPSLSFSDKDFEAVCLDEDKEFSGYTIGFRFTDEAFKRFTSHMETQLQDTGYSPPFTFLDWSSFSYGGGRATFATLQDLKALRKEYPKGFHFWSQFDWPLTEDSYIRFLRWGDNTKLLPCTRWESEPDLYPLKETVERLFRKELIDGFSNAEEIRTAQKKIDKDGKN